MMTAMLPLSPSFRDHSSVTASFRLHALPYLNMSQSTPVPVPDALELRFEDNVPVLVIPDAMPFVELREWIRARMGDILADIGGRASRLDFGTRDIQLFDVRRLLHLLRDEFQVEITGLYVREKEVLRYAERELKLKLFTVSDNEAKTEPIAEGTSVDDETPPPLPGLADLISAVQAEEEDLTPSEDEEDMPTVFDVETAVRRPIPKPTLPEDEPTTDSDGGRRTLTVHRTLRSGATLRYDGDVTVYGDVNPGAQIRAGGNVNVMGRLRGVVHAGAHGDEEAFILAFELAPTQLRIGRQIAIAPPTKKAAVFSPEVAAIVEGSIIIEPYRGRLRR
jgi:septum site-determining protein MinC